MLNRIIWLIATSLIIMSGLYFSFKLKFIQFRFIKMFKSLLIKNKEKDTIKPFESLMMVLAVTMAVIVLPLAAMKVPMEVLSVIMAFVGCFCSIYATIYLYLYY